MGPYEAALVAAHQDRRARLWPVVDVPAPKPEPAPEPVLRPRVIVVVNNVSMNWLPESFVLPVIPRDNESALDISREERRRNSVEQIRAIIRLVSSTYGVTATDIISERRSAKIVKPRQIAMYLAKRITLRSLPEIGRRFGGRDHTTVLHAVRKIEGLIATSPDLAEHVSDLEAQLSQ
jgi:hypothetical protein